MKKTITTLATCVAALMTLGLVMLYSAGTTARGSQLLGTQLMWCALGCVVCIGAAAVDYRVWRKWAWPVFIIAMLLLVLVLVPGIGHRINGARRWFSFGGVSFQPSELGKLALILVLAWYCERYQRQMHTWYRGIVIPGLLVALPLGLIFVEPDRGATILLAAVAGVMLLVAGVQWRYFLPPILVAAVGLAVSIWHDPMRLKRILSWLYLEENKDGVGYQAYQAMLALGSGGWLGLGLGNSRQKLGFVPEHHTDFIFPIIGEELGLVATLGVIGGFVGIVVCGVYIATHARDAFGTMLAAGVTFLIGLQAFINIAVVTSVLPNKGLALPFISYGGSNLVAMLGCVGLLLSVARQGREPEIKSSNPFATEESAAAQLS